MEKFNKFLQDWVLPFLIALTIFLIINIFVGVFRVSGSSMYPTYHNGEFAILNKLFYTSPQQEDVIIFRSSLPNPDSIFGENKRLIKRIIGVPGQHVVIQNGKVFINDEELIEEYLSEGTETSGEVDIVLSDNEYFVMGDNRGNSTDSRYVGPILKDDIIGEVIFTLF